MKIVVSEAAASWFKEDFGMDKDDKIKFYSQIYGTSPIQENYALAFAKESQPIDIAVQTEKNGVTFYVEETHLWFFDGHDLYVDYDSNEDELSFDYKK
ncbi:HesB/YadR/YfhF family protein [Alkalihalobacillus pseudalcaliphilus]|uniref:HesB/YadR/YfhF family protein n=1 Tax=Alkalihalobacillus pseudalcaliphilus TaxID=79884 RepID=UPI00064E0132|nr:iron-sulfur cluster biosynthesis family protein [Alkalihalobacillus pseudalcaliphilus]KMK76197.1 HesB/YadR/YfhF family protein [Alkalihalobacillus pseudalcaliphilus]